MKNRRHYIFYISLLCCASIYCACSARRADSNDLQGTIIYSITYPNEENSVMMDLYPTEMILHFKGEMMHSQIASSYDIMKTDFIIDCENRTFIQLLKNMSKRYGMQLNEEETIAWYKQYPQYKLEPTEETLTIAGYVCNKTIAHVPNDSLPPIDIYHTKGLGIETSNWWNPFTAIDGFLMGYDVEQYGLSMRLRAKEVRFEPVDAEEFRVSDKFQMIEPAAMKKHLFEVVDEYVN